MDKYFSSLTDIISWQEFIYFQHTFNTQKLEEFQN